MTVTKKIIFYVLHPYEVIRRHKLKKLEKKSASMSDEEFLKKAFKIRLGYRLNLDNPKSFNEKLQWTKLNDRNRNYIMMSDKYLVRKFVEEKIGKEFLIPLLGVWNNPDEIDFDSLPNQFVLKCNHNSGLGMCICKDKSQLDIELVKKNLKRGLEQDYYMFGREWPYKMINRKIVCEKFLGDCGGRGINDFKFYCFDGEPLYFLVSSDRMKTVKFDYFDINRNPLPFKQGGNKGHFNAKCIKNFDEMIKIARKLSKGIPHVRIDLYNIDGKIYFGEMTFFDSAGFGRFVPRKWDYIIGEHFNINLESKYNEKI